MEPAGRVRGHEAPAPPTPPTIEAKPGPAAQAAPASRAPEVRVSATATDLGLGSETRGVWTQVVRSIGAKSPIARAVLTNATLESAEGGVAVVTCQPRYLAGAKKLEREIAAALTERLGRPVSIDLRAPAGEDAAPGGPEAPAPPPAGAPEQGAGDDAAAARAAFNPNLALENELVKQAMELFGARVVDVRPR